MTGTRPQPRDRRAHERGRLLARPALDAPRAAPAASLAPGMQALDLAPQRDCLLYVPAGYQPETPAPLVVALHGAGGTAAGGAAPLLPLAGAAGMLLLAPKSRRASWDIVLGEFGPDVAFLDEALATVFDRFAVDPRRLAVSGFSDGGSYALSLGLVNGELFTHVVAFSPGFLAAPEQEGKPAIYISHGTRDEVLPVEACGRRLARTLTDSGYEVRYHEFDGPHTVPPSIAREAVAWFTGAQV